MSDFDRHHPLTADLHAYVIPISPKMLLETLCVVEHALHALEKARPGYNAGGPVSTHLGRIRHLMDECERKRPTGSNGKHDDRHTPECGCGSRSARSHPPLANAPAEDNHPTTDTQQGERA